MVLRRTGSGGGGLAKLGMGKEADVSRLLGEVAGRLRGGGRGGGITGRGGTCPTSLSSSVAPRLRTVATGLKGIRGKSESDDCASSSENGLIWSGLVVLSVSEPGRGGITGFVSIKLCRGLWILLGGELANISFNADTFGGEVASFANTSFDADTFGGEFASFVKISFNADTFGGEFASFEILGGGGTGRSKGDATGEGVGDGDKNLDPRGGGGGGGALFAGILRSDDDEDALK